MASGVALQYLPVRRNQVRVVEVDPGVGADDAVVLAAELTEPGLPAGDLMDPEEARVAVLLVLRLDLDEVTDVESPRHVGSPCLRVVFARFPPCGFGAARSWRWAGWCRGVVVASLRIWRSRSRV